MAPPEVTGCKPIDNSGPDAPQRKRRNRGPPTLAFTIPEFCDAHRISRAHYYELKKRGLAPAETLLLDKVIITAESAATWRRRHTRRTRIRMIESRAFANAG